MKAKIFLIFFLILLIPGILKSQETDTVKKLDYNNDFILKKIINALPAGWIFIDTSGEFIIARTDSVTIAEKVKINISNNQKVTKDSILKYGHKAKSKIIYKYSKRWSYEQTLAAKSNNIQISSFLKKLPKKYNIEGLLDKSKSARFNKVYTGKTDKEKETIIQFENEKKEISSKLIELPTYHSENFSLFLKSISGCNDDNYYVYPAEASLQLYDILTLFSELTEKSNQN